MEPLHNYFGERGDVLLAYLFGSSASNSAMARDIDIGIFLEEKSLSKGVLRVHLEISTSCTRLLNLPSMDSLDLVILNHASPLLKFEVVSKGKIIYEKSLEIRVDFEARTMLQHYEFAPYRRLFWESTVKSLTLPSPKMGEG